MNYRPIRDFRLLPSILMVTVAAVARGQGPASVNAAGNVYIADQFNNRVIEVNQSGNIVWQYGDGSSVPGPSSIVAPNDAERIGEMTLISGTGAPAGAEPTCPAGCADNRVVLVEPNGQIFWQYGQAGVTGSDANQLNTPVCAVQLPGSRDILITDQGNQRVIEVNNAKQIVWQYGTTGVSGSGPNQLNSPNSAELLTNGNILIADLTNNRVIEVNRNLQIVWQYGNPNDTSILNGAAFASRLSNGNTLITDSLNNRIIEIDPSSQIVFEYSTANCGATSSVPTRAVRLRNGDTLVSGQFNHVVVEVGPSGNVVRTIGTLCVLGNGPNQLNAPYDAKVVGDYTGLTPPTDAVVVVGTGTLGTWTTMFDLANPSAAPILVQLSHLDAVYQGTCTDPCQNLDVMIPANGAASVMASSLPGGTGSLDTVFVSSEDPGPLPIVRARVINTANPREEVELPAIRLSTVYGLNPTTLTFPGGLRPGIAHSNLALATVTPDVGQELSSVRVDALGADGTLLGSGTFSNSIDPLTGIVHNLFISDVVGQLGVAAFDGGVIRVTKLSGNGPLWGELSTVYPSGSVSVSVGANP
jgi:hypothetical protein